MVGLSPENGGGSTGVREPGQLKANLVRPQQVYAYSGESRIPALAAWYAISFAKTQCFVDGNKRTALLSAMLFLELNGYHAIEDHEDISRSIVELAEKTLPEEDFVEYFVRISRPAS